MKQPLPHLPSNLLPHQIRTQPDDLLSYGRDWTRFYPANPSAIVFPESTEQVQSLVQWAIQNQISLVPSGGRTGLSGAAVASKGEVVMSLERMNHILSFDETDLTITCQAGVVTEVLQNYVSEKGFYFPVDFASRGSSQIGGNIATNAGGIKVVKYGLMRDWVAGLRVVIGTGEILDLGRSLVKNATGYDLKHLIIGSEGTLGIITEATISVTRAPISQSVIVLAVPDLSAIMQIFNFFKMRLELTAFEMFSDLALQKVLESHSDLARPFATTSPFYVLLEIDTSAVDAETKALQAFEAIVEKGWALDGVLSQSEAQAKGFWRLRENISEALSRFTPYKNDVSVRISAVPEFLTETERVLKGEYPDLEIVWFGHIGDGNLHINILKPAQTSIEDFAERCRRADPLVYSVVQKFGGSISAEHGVGLTKKNYLSFARSPEEIRIMKEIKKVFDPAGILNPGKLI